MNNTEGLRCIEMAETALKKGDHATAERLTQKALRMLSPQDHSAMWLRAQLLYQQVVNKKSQHRTSSQAPSANRKPSENKPKSTTADTHSFSSYSPKRETTGESHGNGHNPETFNSSHRTSPNNRLEVKCQKIANSNNYYEILGVPRNANTEDIKKAYKKMALQLHPDKAKCASAEAAFKVVAKAYQCLSDQEARKYFDTYGKDKETAQQQQSAREAQGYDADFMSAEELFASFFGVQFARPVRGVRTRVYRSTRPQQEASRSARDGETHQFYNLLQIFPLLIIIIMSLISNMFSAPNSPLFSLSRSSDFNIARSTHFFQLPYYVKPNFHRSFPDNSKVLYDLERQIELNYFSSECDREKQPILQQLQRLQFYGTNAQYARKAEELRKKEETSSNCRNYRKLKTEDATQGHAFSTTSGVGTVTQALKEEIKKAEANAETFNTTATFIEYVKQQREITCKKQQLEDLQQSQAHYLSRSQDDIGHTSKCMRLLTLALSTQVFCGAILILVTKCFFPREWSSRLTCFKIMSALFLTETVKKRLGHTLRESTQYLLQ